MKQLEGFESQTNDNNKLKIISTNSNNSSVLLTTNLNPSLHLSNSNILRINHPERFRLKKIISDLIEIFKNKSTTNTIDITFSDEITLYINGMDL